MQMRESKIYEYFYRQDSNRNWWPGSRRQQWRRHDRQPINLPYEILANIVSGLDSLKDIKNVALASHALRASTLPFLFAQLTIRSNYINQQEEESSLEQLEFYARTASRWLKTIRIKELGPYDWEGYRAKQGSRQDKLVQNIFKNSTITVLSLGIEEVETTTKVVSLLKTQDLTSVRTLKLDDVEINAMTTAHIRTILGFLPRCRALDMYANYEPWADEEDSEDEYERKYTDFSGYRTFFMRPPKGITHLNLNLLTLPSNIAASMGPFLRNVTHLTISGHETFPAMVALLEKMAQAGKIVEITDLSVLLPYERREHAATESIYSSHRIPLKSATVHCPRLRHLKLNLCRCAYKTLGLPFLPASVETFSLDIAMLNWTEINGVLYKLHQWIQDKNKAASLKEVTVDLDWEYVQEKMLEFDVDEELLQSVLKPTYLQEHYPELYRRYPYDPACPVLEDWEVRDMFNSGKCLRHLLEASNRDMWLLKIYTSVTHLFRELRSRRIKYRIIPHILCGTSNDSTILLRKLVRDFAKNSKVKDRRSSKQLTLLSWLERPGATYDRRIEPEFPANLVQHLNTYDDEIVTEITSMTRSLRRLAVVDEMIRKGRGQPLLF